MDYTHTHTHTHTYLHTYTYIYREGETLFRISKEKKNIVESKRGVQLVELAMPPVRASGVSIQV